MLVFWSAFFTNLRGFLPHLLNGALVTIQVTFLAFIVALVLGMVVAMFRISRSGPIRTLATTYIDVLRGVPALTQLFLLFFGLGELGLLIDSFSAGVLGLGIIQSAYMAEIYRAGIEAIDRSQFDAARAIGMTPGKVLRHIILPQALGIVVPPAANQLLTLEKETSLVAAIALPELMFAAKTQARLTFLPLQAYLAMAMVYFGLGFPLSRLCNWLEHRFRRGLAVGSS